MTQADDLKYVTYPLKEQISKIKLGKCKHPCQLKCWRRFTKVLNI